MLLMPDLLGFFLTGGPRRSIPTQRPPYSITPPRRTGIGRRSTHWACRGKIFPKLDRAGGCVERSAGAGRKRWASIRRICRRRHARHLYRGRHPRLRAACVLLSGTWSLFGVETDEPIFVRCSSRREPLQRGTIQGGFRPLRRASWACGSFRSAAAIGRRPVKTSAGTTLWEAKKAEPFTPSSIPTTANSSPAAGWSRKFRTSPQDEPAGTRDRQGRIAPGIYESLALKYRWALERLEEIKGQRISTR